MRIFLVDDIAGIYKYIYYLFIIILSINIKYIINFFIAKSVPSIFIWYAWNTDKFTRNYIIFSNITNILYQQGELVSPIKQTNNQTYQKQMQQFGIIIIFFCF